MRPWVRPTLASHVPSLKRGLAIVEHAHKTMESETDQYDERLSSIRANVAHGPRRPSDCVICGGGRDSANTTCHSCKLMLSKELRLLKLKHRQPVGRVCGLCGHTSRKTLHLDHNHYTGEARGYVCNRCNAAVALYDQDPGRFLRHLEWWQ